MTPRKTGWFPRMDITAATLAHFGFHSLCGWTCMLYLPRKALTQGGGNLFFFFSVSVQVSFMSTWHKLESFERRNLEISPFYNSLQSPNHSSNAWSHPVQWLCLYPASTPPTSCSPSTRMPVLWLQPAQLWLILRKQLEVGYLSELAYSHPL